MRKSESHTRCSILMINPEKGTPMSSVFWLVLNRLATPRDKSETDGETNVMTLCYAEPTPG
jgi:hypothetical protein